MVLHNGEQHIESPAFFIGQGQGDDYISFGSGQPDLAPPSEAYKVLCDYDEFKYGAVSGEQELKERVAKDYPRALPEQFVVTNGASEAIDLTLRVLAEPGAKVALPRPYYYSYPHYVELAGMEPIYYDLVDGKIDIDTFKEVTKIARVVVINSPANPTGTVQEVETLKQVEKWCDERGIWVLSDEVYKDLIYTRENYLIQGMRVVTVNSFSKTFGLCGHRVGYLWARDKDFIQKVTEMKSHTSMNTARVSQAMALAALSVRDEYVASTTPVWRARRDKIYKGMQALGLDVFEPEGAFYVLPKFKYPNRVMHDLYNKYKIITYDGAWFGAPDRLRFSFALDEEKIDEGLKKLKEFMNKEYLEY